MADRIISAWNAHDLNAFDALYTPDAAWVLIAEERIEGREAIVVEFRKVHAGTGWAVKTTIDKKDVSEVHFLKPDVATVFSTWTSRQRQAGAGIGACDDLGGGAPGGNLEDRSPSVDQGVANNRMTVRVRAAT
ncbi:SgcJ/EcaC family oxidoreductase [Sphingomonas glacialis]|uniref:SgcJ/EcaC family oxidoreductase n=1 Tax=Sphingomonas glacialis TaxID=658225 RepID=UPI001386B25B|nr:SgcJ/EcaC family oxidoreductase [Sphingomonas glacialis]